MVSKKISDEERERLNAFDRQLKNAQLQMEILKLKFDNMVLSLYIKYGITPEDYSLNTDGNFSLIKEKNEVNNLKDESKEV